MLNSNKKAIIEYLLKQLVDVLQPLSSKDILILRSSDEIRLLLKERGSNLTDLFGVALGEEPRQNTFSPGKMAGGSLLEFRFEEIMKKLRSIVLSPSGGRDAASIEWILRLLMESPILFSSVREVKNFLANITGLHYDAKRPGRDRIVDWYFRNINDFPSREKDSIYFRIARYIFINFPSNYKEWNALLLREKTKE